MYMKIESKNFVKHVYIRIYVYTHFQLLKQTNALPTESTLKHFLDWKVLFHCSKPLRPL